MQSGENNKGKKHVGRPIDDNPPERAREIHRMGGIASGVSKRRKKLIKETIETILELPVKDKRVKDGLKRIGLTTEDMTQQSLMILGVMKRAQNGDPYAATFIRDSIGQKEAEKLDLIQPVQIIVQDDYGEDDK
jgi:coenzyme F420-reducing hydrogenase alpha subunit